MYYPRVLFGGVAEKEQAQVEDAEGDTTGGMCMYGEQTCVILIRFALPCTRTF